MANPRNQRRAVGTVCPTKSLNNRILYIHLRPKGDGDGQEDVVRGHRGSDLDRRGARRLRPAAARRRHPHQRRRRLRPEGAAEDTKTRRSPSTAAARSRTVSGDLPPILQDDHDRIRPPRLGRDHRPAGLHGRPSCEATTVAGAPPVCPGAIVGKGDGHAIVNFPEQAPIPASSPITIFNGPPQARQPDRPRPRLHDGPGRRPPSSSRS